MVTAKQKRVQAIMERHFINSLRGNGGVTKFVKDVDWIWMRTGTPANTKEDGVWNWVLLNSPLDSDDDIMMFLIDVVKITPKEYQNFSTLMKKKKIKGNYWTHMYHELLYPAALKFYVDYNKKHGMARFKNYDW